MRIVALVPGSIDNQILFFPTLDSLKRKYPESQIDVFVEPQSKVAYQVSKSVNDVFTFDYQDRNSLADWGNFVGMIRDREYDLAIIVGQSWFVGLLMWLTGIPTRIGVKGPGSVFFTNVVTANLSKYVSWMYHDLLKAVNIEENCPELAINVPKSAIEWAQLEQKRLGTTTSGFILINGSSKNENNHYPVESWQQIIKKCQEKQPDLPIVVINDSNNEEFVRSLLEYCPEIKVTFTDTLAKVAAIIGVASLMVSVENDYLQLAVGVQTYTIALLASPTAEKILPRSEKILTITSDTGKILDIPPSTVLEKIWGN